MGESLRDLKRKSMLAEKEYKRLKEMEKYRERIARANALRRKVNPSFIDKVESFAKAVKKSRKSSPKRKSSGGGMMFGGSGGSPMDAFSFNMGGSGRKRKGGRKGGSNEMDMLGFNF